MVSLFHPAKLLLIKNDKDVMFNKASLNDLVHNHLHQGCPGCREKNAQTWFPAQDWSFKTFIKDFTKNFSLPFKKDKYKSSESRR